MSAADRLDEIQARADAATDGPWTRYETQMADTFVVGPRGWIREDIVAGPTYERENAEFIAHARADVPRLVAALRAVLDLHTETYYDGPRCTECVDLEGEDPAPEFYPCRTVRAVEAALGEVAP